MEFIAVKKFSSMRYGNVNVGDRVPVTGGIAKQMVDAGMVKLSDAAIVEIRAKQEADRLNAKQEAEKKAKR